MYCYKIFNVKVYIKVDNSCTLIKINLIQFYVTFVLYNEIYVFELEKKTSQPYDEVKKSFMA